jgi:hypothetical protein
MSVNVHQYQQRAAAMHIISHPPLTLIFFAFACDVRGGGGEVDSLILG